MQTSSKSDSSTSLLPSAIGVGIVAFYVLFTLLPNSNSMMVKWPWVFLWQFGLMLGPVLVIFQLWQQSFRRLGSWLDWLAASWALTLVLSAAFAQFTHQAFWYSWAALCVIAFLYGLNTWLTSANRVRKMLIAQGILSIAFSAQSIVSWFFQTVRPYLNTLETLRSYGIDRSFDLKIETLRNWHPIGHQNYVAGYLVLSIPLLIGLAFSQRGWKRWCWASGCVLSLATLYSTASRGSWFGLVVSTAVFIGLSAWQYPKSRKVLFGTGVASLGAMVLWGLSSDRIRGLFTSIFNQGKGGELSYRAITNATGWAMGLDHPILGAGLGSVTLLYQKYRPSWAGREAELTYQLHSTPAQLWAELGLAGAFLTFVSLAAIVWLNLRWCKLQKQTSILATTNAVIVPAVIGVTSGLAGYSIYAITDYQLDNICISGTIIIFVAILIFENTHLSQRNEIAPEAKELISQSVFSSQPIFKRTALAGTGLLAAISIWLYPIHRAWMLSSQGFLALQQKDISSFVTNLEKAHALAPWEPYYPYQLGWNLGELAFQLTADVQQKEVLRQEGIKWLERAITLSPNREFGYSNLGWLQVNTDPNLATQSFLKAAQLVPGKRGSFFALGYSLLREGKVELARDAMVTELLRQPILLTSPIWQNSELQPIYRLVLNDFENELTHQLNNSTVEELKPYLYQLIGSLHWWQGNFNEARIAFKHILTPLNETILELSHTYPGEKVDIIINEDVVAGKAISAWKNPQISTQLFSKALILATGSSVPPAEYISTTSKKLSDTIQPSHNFHSWVTQQAPTRQRRNQRLGFNPISRHIDGSIPTDFSLQVASIPVQSFFNQMFPDSSSNIFQVRNLSSKQISLLHQISESVSNEG